MGGFWDTWPSWLTELVSGIVTFGLAALLLLPAPFVHTPAFVLLLATGLSLVYEFLLDQNPDGKWRDIAQREVGIMLAFAVTKLV